jgi:maltose O-acetyltransferase
MKKMMGLRRFFFNNIITWLPFHCNSIRKSYLVNFMGWTIGNNTHIWPGVKIDGDTYGAVIIGNDCEVARGCYFNTARNAKIILGNKVAVAHDVSFYGVDHDPKSRDFCMRVGDIVVEDNCWVASKSSILRDITIGRDSVIAYGSIVTKSVASNSIVGGVPAKFIKKRFEDA